MQPSALTERARGLMVGIAAGNLLGVVQEDWSRTGDRRGVPGRRPGDRGCRRLPGRRRPGPGDHHRRGSRAVARSIRTIWGAGSACVHDQLPVGPACPPGGARLGRSPGTWGRHPCPSRSAVPTKSRWTPHAGGDVDRKRRASRILSQGPTVRDAPQRRPIRHAYNACTGSGPREASPCRR